MALLQQKTDPLHAIDILFNESDPRFLYLCNSLDQKKELLKLSLQTHHSDTIRVVIQYLKLSLPLETFDQILRSSSETVNNYLLYLTEAYPDRKEWERVLMLTQRYEELGFFFYLTALTQSNPASRLSKLQDCLRFIKSFRCLLQYHQEIEKIIKDLTVTGSSV